jgi:phosphate-selective porin OprO/OprP
VFWKDGVNFEGGDDAPFRFHVGGYFQTDWAFTSGDDKLEAKFGKSSTGTEIRRARLSIDGNLYDLADYKIEYDFATGSAKILDAYFEFKNLPGVGSARVGHIKEPFGLNQLSSDKYDSFMESPMMQDAFIPSRNTGILFQNTAFNKRMTWSVGGFRQTDDVGKGFGSDAMYNLSARVSGLPWYEEQGRKLVHLGFSYSHRFRNNDPVSFNARPEAHLAPKLADTKDIISDGVDLLNPELAIVYGPFSFQAEYTKAMVETPKGKKGLGFGGYYVEASYFLTGENRQYKTSGGTFGATSPKHNFDGRGNWGAWEVATRYSSLDLNDRNVRGGSLSGFTTGVNWYLNPYMRVMANYNLAHRSSFGDLNVFQVRAQLLF